MKGLMNEMVSYQSISYSDPALVYVKMFQCTQFGDLRPCYGDFHFFFSQPAAGLTNQVPVWDSQASTPLFQLQKLAYTIKNAMTIILPQWNKIIEQCVLTSTSKKKLTIIKMPWDVSTQWNLTYNMLKFACTYHDAINKITEDHSLKLCDYELKDHEWKIVEELCNCLKVC